MVSLSHATVLKFYSARKLVFGGLQSSTKLFHEYIIAIDERNVIAVPYSANLYNSTKVKPQFFVCLFITSSAVLNASIGVSYVLLIV